MRAGPQVYLATTACWQSESAFKADFLRLPLVEQARALRKKNSTQRRASILARLMIAGAGFSLDELRYTPSGKPYLAGGPSIAISHSHGVVAVAIAPGMALGIDLELHVPFNLQALADLEDTLSPAERQAVQAAGNGPERVREFLCAWTRKESVLKASGVGLGHAGDLSTLDTVSERLAFQGISWQLAPLSQFLVTSAEPVPEYTGHIAFRAFHAA